MRSRRLVACLAVVVVASFAFAGKPGGGGGPPPDPAIAYTQSGASGYDLMVMNDDGSNRTRVLAGAGNSFMEPAWSPDRTRIAFNGTVNGAGIHVVGLDGSGLTKLYAAATSSVSGGPAWSPVAAPDSSAKILFSDAAGPLPAGNHDLFVMNIDGSGLVNLTNSPDRNEGSPTWSPDALRIAAGVGYYDSAGAWRRDIFVFDLAASGGALAIAGSTNVTDLAASPLRDTTAMPYLAWAKTQDKLVTSAILAGEVGFDLWVIDLSDPAHPTRLTNTSNVEERQATWSSDDSKLAFWRWGYQGKGSRGIFRIAADGSGLATLFASDAVGAPDWRR